MRLRDIAIVVVCIVASIFYWWDEGSISIQPSFTVAIQDSDTQVYYVAPPIITDLNGDGRPEVLLQPQRDYLSIIPTSQIRRSFQELFVPMAPDHSVPLWGNGIAFTAGHLTYPPNRTTKAERATGALSKHIAVVTDDYRLILFDHLLQQQWSAWIVPPDMRVLIPFRASVIMLPESVLESDVGLVVVAVKVPGPNGTQIYSISAHNGASGEIRWRTRLNSFGVAEKRNSTYFDISKMRFTDDDLSRYASYLDWTHYRESVIATLPHAWDHQWNTELHPQAFFHAKSRKKRRPHARYGQSAPKAKYKSRHVVDNVHDFGELGERIGSAGSMHHTSHPLYANALALHTEDGIEIVHLYTGVELTRVVPLHRRAVFHDVDDDFHIDTVSTHVGAAQRMFGPHGVEQAFECKGIVTSGAPVAQDPIYNASVCDSEGYFGALSMMAHLLRDEDQPEEAPGRDPLSLIGSRPVGHQQTTAVKPLVVQHQKWKGNGIYKISRDAVFMIDSGLVTSISPSQKRVVWRADTAASFHLDHSVHGGEASGAFHNTDEFLARIQKYPHLAAYRYHERHPRVNSPLGMRRGNDPIVLAVGGHALVAIEAKTGAVQKTVLLPDEPIAPVVIGDFNGDGTNDLLILTREAYYGLLVYNQNRGSVTGMLMILTVGMILLLFMSQRAIGADDPYHEAAVDSHRRQARYKRSTD